MTMRLAVIDDEVIVCRELSRALKAEGFDVETFQTGRQFLTRMDQFPFHIAFIDLKREHSQKVGKNRSPKSNNM